jgi:replicative DNA helicase
VDLDLNCVSAIVAEGRTALEYALSRGLKVGGFQGANASTVFEALLDYTKAYPGSWPTLDFLIGKTNVLELEEQKEPAKALIDEVVKRNLYVCVQNGLQGANDFLKKIQPEEAYYSLEKLLAEIRAESSVGSQVESIFKHGPAVVDYYDRIKAGERGIQTPWPTLNEMTYGFWPEDLVLFAAKIGTGKTWLTILLAMTAWRTPWVKTILSVDEITGAKRWHKKTQQCRVLFITTEISKVRVSMRLYAAMERLPYGEFTHGRLSFIAEERFYTAARQFVDAEGFYIIGGDFDFRIESVEQAIENCKPDFVIIDGAYLLQAEGTSRTERMALIFNELKRLAKRRRVVVVITTQLNRGSKKGQTDSVELDQIALSDVGGWNADLVFGLIQTDDNAKDKQMTIKPLKVREGGGPEFQANWNFGRMDFTEAIKGGGGDADESKVPPQMEEDSIPEEDLPF